MARKTVGMRPTCPKCGSIKTSRATSKLRKCDDCRHVGRPSAFNTYAQMLEHDFEDYQDKYGKRLPTLDDQESK